jgi:hypothetical protein
MIVRQDDTMVCEDCYMEESSVRPPHREAYMRIPDGICEGCGKVEDRGEKAGYVR